MDRVGAGSLTRVNGDVTDREGRKIRGEMQWQKREYIQTERRICGSLALRMRRARDRESPSGRIQSAQRRSVSRNAAIDYHGPAYRYYRPTSGKRVHTHTHTHAYTDRATFTNARLAPRYLSLSLYLGHTHTPRTNDTASYNTRASNIIGPILPPREINVSS